MGDEFGPVRGEHPNPVGECHNHAFELDLPAAGQLVPCGINRKGDRSAIRADDANHGLHDRKSGIDIPDREDRAGSVAVAERVVAILPADPAVLGEDPGVRMRRLPITPRRAHD